MDTIDQLALAGTDTKVHFDIHMNVHFFTNHKELKEKVSDSIEKNKAKLFAPPDAPQQG